MTPENDISNIGGILGQLQAVQVIGTPTPVKSGWASSEGQITAVVAMVFTFLTLFHFVTPAQATTVTGQITTFLTDLGPIIGIILVVWNYITSRGKLKSNTVIAQATVAAAAHIAGNPPPSTVGGVE